MRTTSAILKSLFYSLAVIVFVECDQVIGVRIEGEVVDRRDGTPIQNAEIRQVTKRNKAFTDSSGEFSIDLAATDSIILSVRASTHSPRETDCTGIPPTRRLRIELSREVGPPKSVTRRLSWRDADAYRRGIEHGGQVALADVGRMDVLIPWLGEDRHNGLEDSSGFPFGHTLAPHDSNAGFFMGYREQIYAWIAENGIPPWSRKQWLSEFKSPSSTFITCYRQGLVDQIGFSMDSCVTSPDGQWHVCPRLRDNSGRSYIVSISRAAGEPVDSWPIKREFVDDLTCCWGPVGSDVLVVRQCVRTDLLQAFGVPCGYLILDLRSGMLISWEGERRNWP